ncbi:MAG TPA: thiol reductant ABC exporter subunit CydC [Candidatus Nanopelagicales bacterium]
MTTVAATAVSPVRRLLPWLRPQRARLLLAALLGALAIGSGVGLLATSAWLISRASQQPPVLELQVAIVAVRAFGIGRGVFRYAERLVSHDAALRSLSALRLAVYDRLAIVAPAGVPAYRRGDLLERMVRDVDTTQDLPLRVLLPYASGAVVAAASVVLAWWLLPAAGVVLLVSLLVAAILVPWLTARAAAGGEAATAQARGRQQADTLTLLDGLADLVAAGAGRQWLDRLARDEQDRMSLARRSAWASGLAAALGVLLSGGAAVAMLIVAVPAVRAGTLPGVELAVLVLLPLATYESVFAMPAAALALGRVRGAAARVVAILDTPDPLGDDRPGTTAVPAGDTPDPGGAARTTAGDVAGSPPALRIRDLSAAWPTGPQVLDGLSLDAPPGSRVAVVGPSGAGKSTLLAVLAKFLPYQGSITLDGVELRELSGDDVRRRIGWCPQSPHVFDTSVAENVRLARPGCSDDEVRAVLDAVGLGPWLDELPGGIDTAVGDHGAQLSGGQRQRLGIARVLLAGHPLVLLDEPTEHLDENTAELVAAELLRALAGRTVLWVAHRPHGLQAMDTKVTLA